MAKAPKEPRKTSDYMVLSRPDEQDAFGWREMGLYSAPTADDAKKAAAKDNAEAFTTFVAVPARSWKPTTRKVEQVMRESWS